MNDGYFEQIIKRVASNDPTLNEVYLWESQIGDDEAIALADALKTNTSITYLYLDGDQIGSVGTIALAEALKTNVSTTKLCLGYNQIWD